MTTTMASSSPTSETYNMYYTTSRCNVSLHHGDSKSPIEYRAQSALFTLQPNIRLHRGSDKHSPTVAWGRVNFFTRHIQIGTGNWREASPEVSTAGANGSSNNIAVKDDTMRRDRNTFHRSDYTFHAAADGNSSALKTYTWAKDPNYAGRTRYHCIDTSTGTQIATLLSGGMFNWSKGGEIHITSPPSAFSEAVGGDGGSGMSQQFEELLLVSAIAIFTAEACWSLWRGYDKKSAKKGLPSSTGSNGVQAQQSSLQPPAPPPSAGAPPAGLILADEKKHFPSEERSESGDSDDGGEWDHDRVARAVNGTKGDVNGLPEHWDYDAALAPAATAGVRPPSYATLPGH